MAKEVVYLKLYSRCKDLSNIIYAATLTKIVRHEKNLRSRKLPLPGMEHASRMGVLSHNTVHIQLLFELPNSDWAPTDTTQQNTMSRLTPWEEVSDKDAWNRRQNISFLQQCVNHTNSEFVWVLGMNKWIRGIHSLAINHNSLMQASDLTGTNEFCPTVLPAVVSGFLFCFVFCCFSWFPWLSICYYSTKEHWDFLSPQAFQSTKMDFYKK